MSKTTTLEGCQIESASFGVRVDGPEDNKLTLIGRSEKPFVAGVFEEQDICRLVAHRCNTFDVLLAACKEGYRLAEIAIRQGLDFDPETTNEIVRDHGTLKMIREAISAAAKRASL
jgi:hypothetical protein